MQVTIIEILLFLLLYIWNHISKLQTKYTIKEYFVVVAVIIVVVMCLIPLLFCVTYIPAFSAPPPHLKIIMMVFSQELSPGFSSLRHLKFLELNRQDLQFELVFRNSAVQILKVCRGLFEESEALWFLIECSFYHPSFINLEVKTWWILNRL